MCGLLNGKRLIFQCCHGEDFIQISNYKWTLPLLTLLNQLGLQPTYDSAKLLPPGVLPTFRGYPLVNIQETSWKITML